MLIAAIRDDAPVVVFEHRWLYGITGDVPQEPYEVPLGPARIARPGRDITIAATSYMVLEALRAAEVLAPLGIDAEVVDVRSLVPLDTATIAASVRKTGGLVVTDTGGTDFGVSAEIVSKVLETEALYLKRPPRRIGLPFCPSPTSPSLAEAFFPRAQEIVQTVADLFQIDPARIPPEAKLTGRWHDVPDPSYTGPY
jgi:pyruvate dehydrogenase E1 component beta subunit